MFKITTISVSLDEEIVEWLDELIKRGVITSRSEAVRAGLYLYIKEKLGISSRKELREYLLKKIKKPLPEGSKVINEVRREEL